MQGLRDYLRDMQRVGGRALGVTAGLILAGALLDSVGLLGILPFFAVITGEGSSEIGAQIVQALVRAGLETQGSQLAALSIGFFGLLLLRGLIGWLRDVRLRRLSLAYVDQWRECVMIAISRADWSDIHRLRRSDLNHAIITDVSRLSIATSQLYRTIAMASIALGQVLIVAYLSPPLFGLVAVLGLLGFLIAWPVTRRASKLGQALSGSGRRMHRELYDFLAAQKLARLSNAQHRMADRYLSAMSKARTQMVDYTSVQVGAGVLTQLIGSSLALLILWIGYIVLNTPIEILTITLIVMVRVVAPIQAVAGLFQQLAHALPAFVDLRSLLRKLGNRGAPDPRPRMASPAPPQRRGRAPVSLTLTDITFSHETGSDPVIKGVSFTVAPREFVALIGPSGSGKTTLLDIATGLLTPQDGSVSVDGKVLSTSADFANFRSDIAYLPQNPFLFDGTVRDNLCWAVGTDVQDDALWEALDQARARDIMTRRGQGLDLRVGDRGEALSGGERQLICLARALVRNPRCLILDEATASLDPEMEAQIIGTLRAQPSRPTILFITHKHRLLDQMDRVLMLSDGQITEHKTTAGGHS